MDGNGSGSGVSGLTFVRPPLPNAIVAREADAKLQLDTDYLDRQAASELITQQHVPPLARMLTTLDSWRQRMLRDEPKR